MHGINGATLGVDVGESWQGSLLKVGVELVGVDDLAHGILLDPLVHPRIDNVGLVVVLPADALLAQRLEDGLDARYARVIGEPARGLIGIVDKTAGRSRCCKLSVGICRSRMLSMLEHFISMFRAKDLFQCTYICVKESKILGKVCKNAALVLGICLDDK